MSLINVWRIPILFLVSGMGVRFAMERRDWKALLKDRSLRILVPFVFGYFAICPIFIYFSMKHYGMDPAYAPNPGHLWFLGNIFAYVLLLLPLLAYLRARPDNPLFCGLKKLCTLPLGLLIVSLPLVAEALIVNPPTYPQYALTPHGFWLGMVCFLVGFTLVSLGNEFWQAAEKTRFIALGAAVALYLVRYLAYNLQGEPKAMVAFESTCWMLAILGFGSRHLNHPSNALSFLSKSVYTVYILHMPVQYGVSTWLIPMEMPATFKLILLCIATLGISFALYLGIAQLRWIAPLFGISTPRRPKPAPANPPVDE